MSRIHDISLALDTTTENRIADQQRRVSTSFTSWVALAPGLRLGLDYSILGVSTESVVIR